MIEDCILLLTASNSVDTLDPRTTDEIRGIDGAIQSATHRDSFQLIQHSGLRVSDLTKLVLSHQPHIMHISGHAKLVEGLILEDDKGRIAKLKCSQLVKLLLSSADEGRLHLVFFSFCYSAECATSISANVPYAIGVRGEIAVRSLLLFTQAFYEALASGKSIQGAFDHARERLKIKRWSGANAIVLSVQDGISAEVPFLSSMGFLKKSVEEALQGHLTEISSRYFSRNVWNQKGLTLEKSYVDLECGSLTWGDITASVRKRGGAGLNPLDESSAPRTDLLAATLSWLQKENTQDFLVIEGSPGSGKSSFTIRLAVELSKQGYHPIWVRLRDLGMGPDPITEIGKKVLQVDPVELEHALEHDKTKAVLIFDGWDELTLVPNQSLIDRVGTFLESIRSTVLARWQGRVPVILTGRPTKAVTSARTLTQNTRILTIYRFSPAQLRDYLSKLDSIYAAASRPDFDLILQRYENDWRSSDDMPSSERAGPIDVIGWPLLAHAAYRLMMECEPSRQTSLIADQTMLLRCLTEYYCIHSRNPSDEPVGTEVRSRFEAHELRSLVQETAIAITVKGSEFISQEELRREMNTWLGAPVADRNVKMARAIDPDIFLINYLFKSGVEYVGCEFIHKSLREFAFAEAVVDQLKNLAEGGHSERNIMRDARIPILSRQWPSKEIWNHIEKQINWEIYRESPAYEDPAVFQRREPALGIDAWCRIRDSLVQLWHDWVLFNAKLPPPKTDSVIDKLFNVKTIDDAVADARLGAALFRLCAILHGTLAAKILDSRGLLNYEKNLWEELGVVVTAGPNQTTLHEPFDRRLLFFSPCKSEERLEPSSLNAALARINAHYYQLEEELPEKCNLSFLVLIGARLERLSFRFSNLSNSNFSESNLTGADLTGAELSGAWLYKSDLNRANLSMTDLRDVSFRQADLTGALFQGADIESADFRESKGLSLEQVSKTRNWQSAKFDPEFWAKLKEFKDTDDELSLEQSE